MNYMLTNVTKFYSKLGEFRENGQFTDVTIECEDGAGFRCHRLALVAASDYFNAMFCGSFTERSSETVVLGEVSGATFQEVLRFIYTGDAKIDYANVYDVLRASEFFHLPDMQDLCVSFIELNTHRFTVQDFLRICLYAYATKIDALTNALEPYLVNYLEIFSKAEMFLEMSFDVVNVLVLGRLELPRRWRIADEIVLGAVMRWVCHRREERWQYVNQMLKLIKFENVSSEFMRVMITNLFADVDAALPRITSSTGLLVVHDVFRPFPDLYVYVKFARENLIRIFNFNSTVEYLLMCGEISAGELGDHQFCTVTLDNLFLYRLNYFGDKNPTEVDAREQRFYAHTSVDMSETFPLKRPPIVFDEVSLCAMRQNIYAYNNNLYQNVTRTDSTTLNDEEIARGMYVYNCEVDHWFTVPEMRKKLEYSSVTTHDNTLYAIGGKASTVGEPMNFVQTYDYREAEWRELSRTQNDYVGAACCAFEDKIYVCGGLRTEGCERYDPVAGKWEFIRSLDRSKSISQHAIQYAAKIWLFDRSLIPESDGPGNYLDFQISNSTFDEQLGYRTVDWDIFSPEFSFECMNEIHTKPTNIVDCVIFDKL